MGISDTPNCNKAKTGLKNILTFFSALLADEICLVLHQNTTFNSLKIYYQRHLKIDKISKCLYELSSLWSGELNQEFQLAMAVNTLNMLLESRPENPISSQNVKKL